jgi:tetratricopeptide (TPR) repeat protein
MADKASITREAQKYLARGQVDKAISEWEKLLRESPDANTYNTVGDLYLKKGDKGQAVDNFHKAARIFRNAGFSLKALALYKKILNINTLNTDALCALGELSEEKGLMTDAIKYYISCADILSKEGKKDAILKMYDKILNISPSNIPLRNRVADLYVKEGLNSEAAKEYVNIARLYDDKNEIDNAKKFYEKALELNPASKESLTGLGSISEKTGSKKDSIEYIRKALALSPDDPELAMKYAQYLINQGSSNEALSYLIKIADTDPANISARKMIAGIYLNDGDKQKAWDEYKKIIDELTFAKKTGEAIEILNAFKDMEPVDTRKKLLPLYKQKGDLESAFEDLVFLGDNYLLSEDSMLQEALNCYREALEIHPDNSEIKGKIEDIEREIGGKPDGQKPDKPIDESLAEADIFLRYGLYDEAKKLLESLKARDKDNIEIHIKLKSLYSDTGDRKQTVTECLTLAELYDKAGNIEQRELILKEAYEIDPDDSRLLDRTTGHNHAAEFTATSFKPAAAAETNSIDNYTEDLAEAEFYTRQGLYEEAREIYKKLSTLFPSNSMLKEKIEAIGKKIAEPPAETKIPEEIITPVQETETIQTEGFSINDILDAQEPAEPKLEGDVMDIFDEFKKGIEKELGTEDAETHYNLGIAYKEMGLVDDAIREFQVARKDPKKFVPSTNMLGICYMAKSLPQLAIEAFKTALDKIEMRDESYWGVKYDLADAYEKSGDLNQAAEIYTEIYGWNSKFRHISDKINNLKSISPSPSSKPHTEKKPKTKKERVSYL